MTANSFATWSKPPRERHAHVGDALRKLIGRAPKAAIELCLYLFEHCIDGKFEDIDLYELPLGEDRNTDVRGGKRYARNTLREALKCLVRLGLIIIKKSYGRGVFLLTVCHPGGKRPFIRSVKNLTERPKDRPIDSKTDKTEPETRTASFPITEDLIEKAEQGAAAFENSSSEKGVATKQDKFLPTAELPDEEGTESLSVGGTDKNCRQHSSTCGMEDYSRTESESLQADLAQQSALTVTEEKSNRDDPSLNTEADEILIAVREAVGINPQIKAEVLKYTLSKVQAAIALYEERRQRKHIPNPQGWLVEALRGKWAMSGNIDNATRDSRFPPELVTWYEWATEKGIADGRPLYGCPGNWTATGNIDLLQVVIPIPPENFRPRDIVPFRYVPWREAVALYPIANCLGRKIAQRCHHQIS